MRVLTFLVLLVLTGTSCISKSKGLNFTDDEFMITVPDSELYVRVRGNASGPLIVNLHGGPGGYSGIDIKLMGPGLENKFMVAYLDQRGCGKSLDYSDKSLLTADQYVEDLQIVIDSLLSRYKMEKINLLGTSWGGMYGFLYLLKYQDRVNAYACIDGKVNSYYQNHSLIDYELELISGILKEPVTSQKRDELLEMQKELLRIRESNFEHFHTDVNRMKHEFPPRLGFNAYFADTSKIISMNDVLNDSALLELMRYSKEEYLKVGEKAEIVNEAFRNTPSYNNMNIENELGAVTVPVAVIQGEKDYVVGVDHGRLIFNAMSNLPENKKELHILPDTGHCPAVEAPDTLIAILNRFFNKHSNIQN